MVVGEFTQETKLLVIGGGPGGYGAAFRAAELDIPTVVVDPRPTLGGVCLYEGCVPSKTLLSISETIALARDAGRFGVQFQPPTIDLPSLRGWTDQVVTQLGRGLTGLAEKHGVQVVRGEARFEDETHVRIQGAEVPHIKFRHAIVATGTVPIEHPQLPFDGQRILTAAEAMRLEEIPPTLLVVGSGYMALEAACIHSALGSAVTLVSPREELLPSADRDLIAPLARRLSTICRDVAAVCEIEAAEVGPSGVQVRFRGDHCPEATSFDRVAVAMGQRPDTTALAPERAGISLDEQGYISVDEQMRTSNPRILAVGDITGRPLLADKALHQGRIAAEVLDGWDSAFDARTIPMVVFADPQVAWCGLTESEAQAQDIDVTIKKISWRASGRAVGMGRSDGLTKILLDPDTKLVLGVGMVGPHAGEMIGEGCLAIEMGAVATDLASTIHPHPTAVELLSDVAREAGEESD